MLRKKAGFQIRFLFGEGCLHFSNNLIEVLIVIILLLLKLISSLKYIIIFPQTLYLIIFSLPLLNFILRTDSPLQLQLMTTLSMQVGSKIPQHVVFLIYLRPLTPLIFLYSSRASCLYVWFKTLCWWYSNFHLFILSSFCNKHSSSPGYHRQCVGLGICQYAISWCTFTGTLSLIFMVLITNHLISPDSSLFSFSSSFLMRNSFLYRPEPKPSKLNKVKDEPSRNVCKPKPQKFLNRAEPNWLNFTLNARPLATWPSSIN
jgi:hypothetical protein